jgi:hypothetical protein
MSGNAARVAHLTSCPSTFEPALSGVEGVGFPQLCRAWASSTTSLEAFSLSEPVHVPQGAVPRAAQEASAVLHVAALCVVQAAAAVLRVPVPCAAQAAAAALRVVVPCAAQAVSAALPVAVPCAAQVAGTHA